MNTSFPVALPDLNPGERYAGLILDAAGTPTHHLVLMAQKPEGRLSCGAANAWAKGIDASLPTRQEQALLYANLKENFEAEWYWSSEPSSNSPAWAWCQYFDDGSQSDSHKDLELRARAVRRLPI